MAARWMRSAIHTKCAPSKVRCSRFLPAQEDTMRRALTTKQETGEGLCLAWMPADYVDVSLPCAVMSQIACRIPRHFSCSCHSRRCHWTSCRRPPAVRVLAC